MNTEIFSIEEFEKKIDKIEHVVDKVEFISTEILKCKKTIQEIKKEVINFPTLEIVLTTRTKQNKNSFIEILNLDNKVRHNTAKMIKDVCAKNICHKYEEFLERAESHLHHYKTVIKTRSAWNEFANVEKDINTQSNYVERIVWRIGKDKLIELFDCLHRNEIIPKYSREEILVHFTDEKQEPLCKGFNHFKKFNWYDSDCAFSVFVDELSKRGAIEDEGKYKVFANHFINKKGNPFKDLPQKRNYTENFTKTGNFIRKVLDDAKIMHGPSHPFPKGRAYKIL